MHARMHTRTHMHTHTHTRARAHAHVQHGFCKLLPVIDHETEKSIRGADYRMHLTLTHTVKLDPAGYCETLDQTR